MKIPVNFKYCINCEGEILVSNIDFHEKYECKNFSLLYEMSFEQLSAVVGEKIEIIEEKIKK